MLKKKFDTANGKLNFRGVLYESTGINKFLIAGDGPSFNKGTIRVSYNLRLTVADVHVQMIKHQ